MAEINTRTKRLSRDKIAKIFGPNHEAIKFIEDLQADVTEVLPAAVDDTDLRALFSLQSADGSKSNSQSAQRLAIDVETVLLTMRTQRSEITRLQLQIDEMALHMLSLQRQIGDLSTLRQAIEELRALNQGI